ncbi:MAG: FimV/HubP family polar landmark protein [Burkholderiaceae bacterium]
MVSALLVAHASAAGLGKLTVLSGIGQPLRAEIELTTVSPDEARSLQPKLASMDAFRQANIEFSPALQSLRFAVEQRGGRQLIRITSTQPFSEPFVDVLLELNGATGRLVREYTFLLDPPELRNVQPAQTAIAAAPLVSAKPPERIPLPSRAAAGSRPRTAASGPTSAAPASGAPVPIAAIPRERAGTARTASSSPLKSEYQVQKGDSLSRIAKRTRPEGISLDQMLVALYRANPDAFIGNNMNRLRAGQILAVPSGEVSGAVSTPDAHGIVIAQAVDFSDYRNKLAGQVATGASQKAAENRQSASGKISARVEERASAASESPDKLKLSKADAAATGISAASQEDRAAREKAAIDTASRVKDLEKNVSDLQKLLAIKSRDLAERQKKAEGDAKTSTVGPTSRAAVVAPLTEMPAGTTSTTIAPSKPAVAAAPPPAPVAAALLSTPKPTANPVTKPAVKTAVPESSVFDDVLTAPVGQAGAALLVALLAALAYFRARTKKSARTDGDSALSDSSLKANSLFGSTGGQSVDTNNSVFNSSFAPAASNLDSNEVDPVAEADVYIAYGRDAQAEEILKEALRTQPARNAVRVKLLEIYASRKDRRAFESVATELYSMSKGEGDDWAQAATMGFTIDPENPLYAGGKTAADGVIPDPRPQLPEDTTELDALLEDVGTAHASNDVKPAGREASLVDTGTAPIAAMDFRAPEANGLQANGAAESPPAAAPVSTNTLQENDHLDFDLDGSSFDAMNPPGNLADGPAASSHGQTSPVAHDPDLELTADKESGGAHDEAPLSALDFDFLRHDVSPVAPPVTTHGPRTEPVSIGDFDLALPERGEPLPGELPSPFISEIPLSVAAATQSGVQAHATGAAAEHPTEEPARPAHDVTHAEIAEPLPLPAADRPDPFEFDLSGITLDLPDQAVHGAPTAFARPPQLAGATTGAHEFHELDLDTLTSDEHDGSGQGGVGNAAEMATKLDLAVAYQEIGDHEGARELLDEVVRGGNTEQSDKAKSILARLA